jgi:hypothetical protein
MRLYLDDDHASPQLAERLRKVGHEVELPLAAGLSGNPDADHMLHAIQTQRTLLTGNQRDFEALHALVRGVAGHHPGIIIVCRESNPHRNMRLPDIVRAVGKLAAAGLSLTDQVQILNQWR